MTDAPFPRSGISRLPSAVRGAVRAPAVAAMLCIALLGSLLGALVGQAGAQASEQYTDIELRTALTEADALADWYAWNPFDPSLALVVVEGTDHLESRQVVIDLATELVEKRELQTGTGVILTLTKGSLERVQDDLAVQRQTLTDTRSALRRTDIERNRRADDRAVIHSAIEASAVYEYVGGSVPVFPSPSNIDRYNSAASQSVTVLSTLEDFVERKVQLDGIITGLETDIALLEDEIVSVDTIVAGLETNETNLLVEIENLVAELAALEERIATLEVELVDSMEEAHETRRMGVVPVLGEPLVVLDAYVRAVRHAPFIMPGCAIQWPMLAGIAQVETMHGTFGGAEVLPDGNVNSRILGPLLDGSLADNATILDTDGGILDNNSSFDAAVGPFQFIPGTWKFFAWDGDGDRIADPHNMYDGALSAAVYLCSNSPMITWEQIRLSVLRYNESEEYLAATTGFADQYAALVLPGDDTVPEFETELDFPDTLFGPGLEPVPTNPGDIIQSRVPTRDADEDDVIDPENPDEGDEDEDGEDREEGDVTAPGDGTDGAGTDGDLPAGDGPAPDQQATGPADQATPPSSDATDPGDTPAPDTPTGGAEGDGFAG